MSNSGNSKIIDLEMYERWLPVFKNGLLAQDKLNSGEPLTRADRIRLRTAVNDGNDAFEHISVRVEWLVNKVVREEMQRPRSFHVILEEDDLKQAGYEGVYKMLRKTDLNKMSSGTNYLLNWIKTNVERAASKSEAAYGLPPSRLRVFKKISAVRAKMTTELGREPSDEEVLDYFHSGKADWKSLYGKKNSNKTAFKENSQMSLKTVREQRETNTTGGMRIPVTDEHAIDSEISVTNDFDDTDSESKAFWVAFFKIERIDPEQWSMIAVALDLYNTKDDLPKSSKMTISRITDDFKKLIAHDSDNLKRLASKWDSRYGEGSWSVFSDMPSMSAPKPSYKVLKFDTEGKEENEE